MADTSIVAAAVIVAIVCKRKKNKKDAEVLEKRGGWDEERIWEHIERLYKSYA